VENQTDNVEQEETKVEFDTQGIAEALDGYRNGTSNGNDEIIETETEKSVNDEPDNEPNEPDKSFKDDPENQRQAANRRKEKIAELRQQNENIEADKEKDIEARVEAKMKEMMEKQGVKPEPEADPFETKQKELMERYEETGDLKYYDEYRDNIQEKALDKQKADMQTMLDDRFNDIDFDKQTLEGFGKELIELNDTYGTNFKNLDALAEDPKYDEFMQYAEEKGVSLADSYFLAHKEDILNKTKAKAVKEATKHGHIRTAGVAGGNVDNVELDSMDMALAKGFGFSKQTMAKAIKNYG